LFTNKHAVENLLLRHLLLSLFTNKHAVENLLLRHLLLSLFTIKHAVENLLLRHLLLSLYDNKHALDKLLRRHLQFSLCTNKNSEVAEGNYFCAIVVGFIFLLTSMQLRQKRICSCTICYFHHSLTGSQRQLKRIYYYAICCQQF
jgi:hypothetical protein